MMVFMQKNTDTGGYVAKVNTHRLHEISSSLKKQVVLITFAIFQLKKVYSL